MSLDGIEFRILDESSYDKVVEFIGSNFVPNEPLFKHLKVSKEAFTNVGEDHMKRALQQKVSIGAYDRTTGELVALRLSLLGRNEEKLDVSKFGELDLNLQQFFQIILAMMGDGFEEIMDTKHYLQFFMVCTKKEYGKRGIAAEMYGRSEAIALGEGCQKIFTIATSEFTNRIASKRGYQSEKEIIYKNYVDPITNEKILENVEKPHTRARLMIKNLC